MTFGNFVKAVLIIYAFSLGSLMNTSLTVLQDRRNGIRRGKVHYEEATWWKLASLLEGTDPMLRCACITYALRERLVVQHLAGRPLKGSEANK